MKRPQCVLSSRAARGLVPAAVLASLALAPLLPHASALGQARLQGDGFLFREPTGSITFQLGFARPRAQSEIFASTRELLTLNDGDFNSLSLGVEYARQLQPRLDLVIGIGYAGSSERSEFRDWVDQDDLPIEQTTTFTRIPFSAAGRYYVLPRGRSIGRFAWFPSAAAPYVTAGGGVLWYSFRQNGDFVDFADLEVFSAKLESAGWALHGFAGGGIEFSLSPLVVFATEGRYAFGSAAMDADFSGYDNIDLSGLTATAGIRIRF
jgi:hypothetical protein